VKLQKAPVGNRRSFFQQMLRFARKMEISRSCQSMIALHQSCSSFHFAINFIGLDRIL
jgi:hypothetical protein